MPELPQRTPLDVRSYRCLLLGAAASLTHQLLLRSPQFLLSTDFMSSARGFILPACLFWILLLLSRPDSLNFTLSPGWTTPPRPSDVSAEELSASGEKTDWRFYFFQIKRTAGVMIKRLWRRPKEKKEIHMVWMEESSAYCETFFTLLIKLEL